jgi:hypothetical protein
MAAAAAAAGMPAPPPGFDLGPAGAFGAAAAAAPLHHAVQLSSAARLGAAANFVQLAGAAPWAAGLMSSGATAAVSAAAAGVPGLLPGMVGPLQQAMGMGMAGNLLHAMHDPPASLPGEPEEQAAILELSRVLRAYVCSGFPASHVPGLPSCQDPAFPHLAVVGFSSLVLPLLAAAELEPLHYAGLLPRPADPSSLTAACCRGQPGLCNLRSRPAAAAAPAHLKPGPQARHWPQPSVPAWLQPEEAGESAS